MCFTPTCAVTVVAEPTSVKPPGYTAQKRATDKRNLFVRADLQGYSGGDPA